MNWWYRLLGKLGMIKNMPPIDENKVRAFLATWNKGRPSNDPLWTETTGEFALMKMNIGQNNIVTFDGNVGYPLKAFKNKDTQEIRIFDARRFS